MRNNPQTAFVMGEYNEGNPPNSLFQMGKKREPFDQRKFSIFNFQFSILSIILFFCLFGSANAKSVVVIPANFDLFTSNNLQGYTKPLFTSIGESFNSSLYTRALYPENFRIGFDISAMGMFIPSDQKNFDAELPDKFGDPSTALQAYNQSGKKYTYAKGSLLQPTLYGGQSQYVFSTPQELSGQKTFYHTVVYPEGFNISFMAGIPTLQLIGGFPTRTEVRFRFAPIPLSEATLYYFGIGVDQQIDHFFNLFGKDTTMGIAVNLAYHSISWDDALSFKAWAAGIHFSKSWFNMFSVYGGIQYEDIGGSFEAVRDTVGLSSTVKNSPYKEVRDRQPLKFDISGFTKFRITAGAAIKLSVFEFHLDFAYASQPIITGGLMFHIASFGGKKQKVIIREEHEETIN